MSGGEELYQQAIKDWAQADHGHGRLDPADAAACADSPLCGDRVRLTLRLDSGRVAALAQETRGCLLCRAAASLLGRRASGMDAAAAASATAALEALLAEGRDAPPAWPELAMFAPARSFRSRHKCVLLPFRALRQALEGVSHREQ
ncbi:MAG: iron-sulfur cluster assembly scaffold protein [Rhodocyclales bacterium]|nr:iron-sulfur cluster assembly scaffold protein [Rhodocyclales bacterium]